MADMADQAPEIPSYQGPAFFFYGPPGESRIGSGGRRLERGLCAVHYDLWTIPSSPEPR
jgi:hypothetical protein